MRKLTAKQLEKLSIKYKKMADSIRGDMYERSVLASMASQGLMYQSDRVDFLFWCKDYGYEDICEEHKKWSK